MIGNDHPRTRDATRRIATRLPPLLDYFSTPALTGATASHAPCRCREVVQRTTRRPALTAQHAPPRSRIPFATFRRLRLTTSRPAEQHRCSFAIAAPVSSPCSPPSHSAARAWPRCSARSCSQTNLDMHFTSADPPGQSVPGAARAIGHTTTRGVWPRCRRWLTLFVHENR